MTRSIHIFIALSFVFLFITEGRAQIKRDFNSDENDVVTIDSLIQRYQDQGLDFKAASEKAGSEMHDNGVMLRYQTYIDNRDWKKSGLPRPHTTPGSIKVNRNEEIKRYTPTELVRNILLKSYEEADKQRIQNVRFFGVGGDGSANAPSWLPSDSASIMPADSLDRTRQYYRWSHSKRAPISGDRSLAYFEQDDTKRFPLKKGLVLSTAGTFAVEGPNEDMLAFSVGVNYKGQWAGKTAAYGAAANIVRADTAMFDVDATNTMRTAQPSGNSTYGAVLEFDFKPAVEEMKFDFIFGSEEYARFVQDQYNDVFGFYVSGPFDEMPDGSPKVDDYGTLYLNENIEKRALTDKAYTTTTPSPPKVLNTIDTVNYNGKEIKRYVRYNIAQLPNGDPVGVNTVNWGYRNINYRVILDYAHWGLSSSDYQYPDILPFEPHPDTIGFVTNMLPSFKASFPPGDPQITAAEMLLRRGPGSAPSPADRGRGVNMAYFRPIMKDDPLVEVNGLTTKLEAKADQLVPDKWYHLKIVIAQADYNHGGLVFLSNLDLGASIGKLEELPPKTDIGWNAAWDTLYGGVGISDMSKEGDLIAMYDACPRTLDVTLKTTVETPIIDLTFNDIARDYLDVVFEKELVKDSILLKKNQREYKLRVTSKQLPDSLNGKVGIITSMIRGTTTKDTIFKYTAYNHPKTEVRYKQQTPNYRGQLALDITGGTPYLFASVNQGRTWFSTSKETPRSELRDLPDTFNIWLREPNCSCDDIIIPVIKGYGVKNVVRTIELPTFSNATTTPHAGLWKVESRDDFVFILTPTEENRDKTPFISTDRQLFNDLKNPPVVTKNNDGSYTVTIKEVTEDFKVSVDFPLITGISEEISPQVWTSRSQLYVHALEQQQVQVYTLQGMLTKAFDLVPGETRCTTLPAGIYLVRLGSNNKTYKVVINE